ncbi:DUF4336 domain-containing protein [Engelhardtia mirabilis]|uniref:DUF4336 domain-containing protein n=1 Tax=Engelhardtia mirabilis TaxID=2528011 RepID=A0A518BRA3_9BACT|nr:hypothetical protein Pla133_46060 [Planctomycetes bacterium Pla133]QDV03812.1 hypothetical protein Pla86_46040 [Planctomycetes bacterium Pla86]
MAATSSITPLTDDLWTVQSDFGLLGMPLGHRMTVAKLSGGGLWLHSPVPWSADLVARLAELGPIEHWVAPSRTHDLYLDQWFEHLPAASTWGAPKLRRPHPEWNFTGWLAEDLDAPWRGEFELLPLEGAPRVGEWMFLHRASRTAITADAVFNLGTATGGWGGLMQRMLGIHGEARAGRLMRSVIKDREAWNASLGRVLEWDFERLVVGHGEPITEDPKGKLRAAWGL